MSSVPQLDLSAENEKERMIKSDDPPSRLVTVPLTQQQQVVYYTEISSYCPIYVVTVSKLCTKS